jgi:hypothetical protein
MGRSRTRLPGPDSDAWIGRDLRVGSEALRQAEIWTRARIYGLSDQELRSLYELYTASYRQMAATLTTAYDYEGNPHLARRAELLRQIETEIQRLAQQTGQSLDDALLAAYEQGYAGRAWALDVGTNPDVPVRMQPVLPHQAIRSLLAQPLIGEQYKGKRYMGSDWRAELGMSFTEFSARTKRALMTSMIQGEGIAKAQRRLRDEYGIPTDRRKGFHRNFYQTTMIARTELLRASNLGALAVYEQNQDILRGWEWLASKDERTCFPAWVRVTTARGDVPISEIAPGDRVLTRSGFRRVVATSKREYRGHMTGVLAGKALLVSTPDHPFWTERGWIEAGTLRAGDMTQTFGNQRVEVRSVSNVLFSDANNAPSALGKKGIAARIFGRARMPVIAVNFKRNRVVSQGEVNRVSADLKLLSVDNAEPIKAFADSRLKRRFAGERAITAKATKRARSAWAYTDTLSAVATLNIAGRAAAFFGTVSIVGMFGNKRGTAAGTLAVERIGNATGVTTDSVSVSIDGLDSEVTATRRTGFGYVLRNARLFIAFAAAILAIGIACMAIEGLSTMGAIDGDLPRTNVGLPGMIAFAGTVFAAFSVGTLKRGAAPGAGSFKHIAIISRVARQCKNSIMVYDIEVDGAHEFFAEGILVHNCPICAGLDGKVFGFDDPQPQPPSGSHPGCRCTITPALIDTGLADRVMGGPRETYAQWKARVGMQTDGGLVQQRMPL